MPMWSEGRWWLTPIHAGHDAAPRSSGDRSDGALRRRPSARAVLACLAVIAVADALLWLWRVPLGVQALWDEPAHIATGLLAVAALGVEFRAPVLLALVAGSVLIDLDHVPALLGSDVLNRHTARPYTHSLVIVVAVMVVGLLMRRERRKLMLIAVLALVMHLFRDVAEPGGSGAPLLWPISDRSWTLGYGWYAGVVIALGVIALVRPTNRSGIDRWPGRGRTIRMTDHVAMCLGFRLTAPSMPTPQGHPGEASEAITKILRPPVP